MKYLVIFAGLIFFIGCGTKKSNIQNNLQNQEIKAEKAWKNLDREK